MASHLTLYDTTRPGASDWEVFASYTVERRAEKAKPSGTPSPSPQVGTGLFSLSEYQEGLLELAFCLSTQLSII